MSRFAVFLSNVLCVVACRDGSAQDAGSLGPIPSTISPEAQEFLRSAQPITDAQIRNEWTPEEYTQWRTTLDENWRRRSERLVDRYGAKVESEKLGGVDVCVITPKGYDTSRDKFAIAFIHGGGFVIGSPECTYGDGVPIAAMTGVKVYSIGYRLAPEHRYPAGLDDCLEVYRALIAQHDSKDIGIFGGSAGGALTLTVVLKARAAGLPMPGAIVPITPWTDLDNKGDSYGVMAGKDPVLHSYS